MKGRDRLINDRNILFFGNSWKISRGTGANSFFSFFWWLSAVLIVEWLYRLEWRRSYSEVRGGLAVTLVFVLV